MTDRMDRVKQVLKKWGQSIIELLVLFPALLIIGIYVMPHHMLWLWLGFVAVYYLVGLLAGRLLARNRMITHILVGAFISGAGAYFLFGTEVYVILPLISATAAFVRGIQLKGSRWEDIFPPAELWIGLVVYFIGYFFFSRVEALKPYSSVVGWVGIIYMVLVLFVINITQLKSASLPGDREPVLPGVLKKHNRVLITIMLLVIMIISFFDSLKKGVQWLVNGIIYLVWRFIIFLTNLLSPSYQQGAPDSGGGIQDLFPPVEERPPSIFDRIIEIIGIILAVAAGLVLLGLLGLMLYRLMKKIAAWLSRFYQLGNDMEDYGGYIDEKESSIDFRELGRDYAQRFRQWLAGLMEREPKWNELKTNRERVRYIYRHFLLRCMANGYSFKEYQTPAETGKELVKLQPDKAQYMDELISAYDDVRYGDKEIDDNGMERLIQTFLKE